MQGIGDRLGILEKVSEPNAEPSEAIQTKVLTLRELASEINSADVRALADLSPEPELSFAQIFLTAGISSPPEAWNVDKLKQVVLGEPLKNKSREEIQRAVLDMLHSEGIPVEDVVKDAIARDQALDEFESFAREKKQKQTEMRQKKILEIESRIKDLQDELMGLREKSQAEEKQWIEWKRRKRAHEQEMALIIGYLVDHPVITTEIGE